MNFVFLGVFILLVGGGILLWIQHAGTTGLLTEGDMAPAFALPNQDGQEITLSDMRGHWLVIYFYPKDDTPGCTREACAFRDKLNTLQEMKVSILGVSYDDVASHKAFSDKYHLNFDLLADPEGSVIAAYGARGLIPGFSRRVSYLLDDNGMIRKVYPEVTPGLHASEIITDVKDLKK